jgi:hypothetical protein
VGVDRREARPPSGVPRRFAYDEKGWKGDIAGLCSGMIWANQTGMSNTDLKARRARLIDPIATALASDGYKFKSASGTFEREVGGYIRRFQLVVTDAKPGWMVRPNVGIRVKLVEDILHRHSGFERKHQAGTTTVGGSVGELRDGRLTACQFPIKKEDDPASSALPILEVYRSFAVPYFDKFSDLAAIDQLLNADLSQRVSGVGPPFLRLSRGLIVAHMLRRPDFDDLASRYSEQLTTVSDGFYLKWFTPLLAELRATPLEL